jgi:hypothetical protein
MADLSPIRKQTFKRVYDCVKGAGAFGMSIREAAVCAGFKGTSPMVTEMLDQLVSTNWQRKEQSILQTGRGARMGWRYFATSDSELTF